MWSFGWSLYDDINSDNFGKYLKSINVYLYLKLCLVFGNYEVCLLFKMYYNGLGRHWMELFWENKNQGSEDEKIFTIFSHHF